MKNSSEALTTEIPKVKWHTDGLDLGLTIFAGALAIFGRADAAMVFGGIDLVLIYNKVRKAQDTNEKALIDVALTTAIELGRQIERKEVIQKAKQLKEKKRQRRI